MSHWLRDHLKALLETAQAGIIHQRGQPGQKGGQGFALPCSPFHCKCAMDSKIVMALKNKIWMFATQIDYQINFR
jgi:hypothetical protein